MYIINIKSDLRSIIYTQGINIETSISINILNLKIDIPVILLNNFFKKDN